MKALDLVVSDKKIFENCIVKTYFLTPWPTYATNWNGLNNFDRGPPKDHSCEVWSKSKEWFQRRCCLKKLLTDARTMDDGQWAITKAHLELFVLRWANKKVMGPTRTRRRLYAPRNFSGSIKMKQGRVTVLVHCRPKTTVFTICFYTNEISHNFLINVPIEKRLTVQSRHIQEKIIYRLDFFLQCFPSDRPCLNSYSRHNNHCLQ